MVKILKKTDWFFKELLTQYGPIAGIWFDSLSVTEYNNKRGKFDRLTDIYDYIRQLQPQCLISSKFGPTGNEDFTAPEHNRYTFKEDAEDVLKQVKDLLKEKPCEICTTIQDRVEYKYPDIPYKPYKWFDDIRSRHKNVADVLKLLGDAEKCNSNLLLNIGLVGDGSVHPDDIQTLTELGNRLKQGISN